MSDQEKDHQNLSPEADSHIRNGPIGIYIDFLGGFEASCCHRLKIPSPMQRPYPLTLGPWDPGPPKASGDGNRSAAKRPAAVSARRDLERGGVKNSVPCSLERREFRGVCIVAHTLVQIRT